MQAWIGGGQEPRQRGSRSRAGRNSDSAGRSPSPAGVPRTTRRRSIMDKSSAWADGSVLAWPQGNSAREQMASRWPGGGNDAAAPAVTTSSDSGRAQDWQQRRCGEQAPWPVQERGGEDWRGSALVSRHTQQWRRAHCCNRRGGERRRTAAQPRSLRSSAGAHQARGDVRVGGPERAHLDAAYKRLMARGLARQGQRGGVGGWPAADERGSAPGRGVVRGWAG